MKTITLGETVMISDPCYEVPTWCQHILRNVLPGNYKVFVEKSDEGNWGNRVAALFAIHEDYIDNYNYFRRVPTAHIGVDSGQAGIFDMDSYRNDSVFEGQESGFYKMHSPKDGDHWYGFMCERTLNDEMWGTYDRGVVSSTGYGDGSYELRVTTHKGKITGMMIDYHLLKYTNEIINEVSLRNVMTE